MGSKKARKAQPSSVRPSLLSPLPTNECTAFPFPKPIVLLEIRKALGGSQRLFPSFLFAIFCLQVYRAVTPIIGNLIKQRVVMSGVRNYEIIFFPRLSVRLSVHPSTHNTSSIERVFICHPFSSFNCFHS